MYSKLMYNHSGCDDCYATLESSNKTNKQIVETLCSMVSFCKGVPFNQFEEEYTDENGSVFGFDGIGIFIAKDCASWESLYKKWYKDYMGEDLYNEVFSI